MEYKTERISKKTSLLLDEVLEIIIKKKIVEGTFKIDSLVKRRFMSFDDEIHHIAAVYKELVKDKKIFKIIKKINKCYT